MALFILVLSILLHFLYSNFYSYHHALKNEDLLVYFEQWKFNSMIVINL